MVFSEMEERGTPAIPSESTVTLAASAVSVLLVMPKSLQGQCTPFRALHQSVSVWTWSPTSPGLSGMSAMDVPPRA